MDRAGILRRYRSQPGYDSATVYQLTYSNGDWIHTVVYDFGGEGGTSGLVLSSAGDLYGTNSLGFWKR